MKARFVASMLITGFIFIILPTTVVGQPRIEVDPVVIDFGVADTATSVERTVSITNAGDETLSVISLETDDGVFNAYWRQLDENDHEIHFDCRTRENNSSILIREATWDGEPLPIGDEVGALTPGGVCAGGRMVEEFNEQMGFAVWANDAGENEDPNGFRNGDEFDFRFWDPVTETEVQAEAEFLAGVRTFRIDALSMFRLSAEGGSHRLGNGPVIVVPDDAVDAYVSFTPALVQIYEGNLTITSNDEEDEEIVVELFGRGVPAGQAGNPIIIEPNEDDLYPVIVHEGDRLVVEFQAEDQNTDGDDLVWAVVEQHDLPGEEDDHWSLSNEGNGRASFVWAIDFSAARDYPYRPVLRVSDPENNSDEIELVISVWGAPFPPPEPIPDPELLEDDERVMLFDLDAFFVENELDFCYEISVNPPQLQLELDGETNELSAAPIADFWIGRPGIEVVVTASTEDESFEMGFNVVVDPRNDPPEPFHQLMPENYSIVNWDGTVRFSWEEAEQNQYEMDEVRYRLFFRYRNLDRADTLITSPMEMTEYDVRIVDVADSLGIAHGAENSQIIWWVMAQDDSAEVFAYNAAFVFEIDWLSSPGDDDSGIPSHFMLLPAYPNPFNSRTTVGFALPSSGAVTVSLFNLRGRLLPGFSRSEYYIAGHHQLAFEMRGVPAGVYMLYVEYGGDVRIQKLLLMK
ncbi:T9SS type A sorting domain-containing protein [bacterium]|nr:T9SS type A sorting domain-containing protein [bacterium]